METKTILAGRLVADPKIRYTQNETPVCHFQLSINKPAGKDGVNFVDCVVFGSLAKVSGEYLKKGSMVAVEGRLQIRIFENSDKQKKQEAKIVADHLQILGHHLKKGGN